MDEPWESKSVEFNGKVVAQAYAVAPNHRIHAVRASRRAGEDRQDILARESTSRPLRKRGQRS